jgi:flagellar hook-associated protein 3 FlgL
MRVTESMMFNAANSSLANEMTAIQNTTEQIASSKKLNKPSDNPADVRTAIGLNDTLAQLNQYGRNIDSATRTLSAMDMALSSAGDLLQRANELAIQGANGTLSASDRQAIGAEVSQLTEAMAQTAGAKVGDDYIFSGFKVGQEPYQVVGPGQVGAYLGDHGVSIARIGPASTMQVSLSGDAVFGPAIAAMTQLQTDLAGGQPVQQSTISQLSDALSSLTQAQATVGARENRLSAASTSQQDLITSNQAMLSSLEDVNMPAAITELTQRQTTYQASLAITAKVMQTNLISYLPLG